jgi:uncharacterized membrane protein
MGMHWAWWLFWIATIVVVAYAFWRLHAERAEARREAARLLEAEEVLRRRYAQSEIGEEELLRRTAALQGSRSLQRV